MQQDINIENYDEYDEEPEEELSEAEAAKRWGESACKEPIFAPSAEYPCSPAHQLSSLQRGSYNESQEYLTSAIVAFNSLKNPWWSFLYWHELKPAYTKIAAIRNMPWYTSPELIDALLIASEDIRQCWKKWKFGEYRFGISLVPFEGTYLAGKHYADGASMAMICLRGAANCNALIAYQEQFNQGDEPAVDRSLLYETSDYLRSDYADRSIFGQFLNKVLLLLGNTFRS